MTLTTNLLTRQRDAIKADLQTIMLFGAVGDDNTAPTPSDTTLGNETFRSAIDAFDNSVSDAITASLVIGSAENNGNDIEETGWFDDVTAGTMWMRFILTTITKTSDIQLFLDTTVTILVEEV